MASLEGRHVVITGATDGIGRVAAQRLAEAGANVMMIGRNEAKTAAVGGEIMKAVRRRNVQWEIADLSLQYEIRQLAERLSQRLPAIDALINNAGAIFADRELTPEGLERTFALNHLAYFSLTLLLLENLLRAAQPGVPARVIIVSSDAHRRAALDVADLQSEENFRPWRAYSNSKLENLLFMRALVARVDASKIVVHALHPGVVATRFAVDGNGVWGKLNRRAMNVISVSPAEGADTMVWLGSAPNAATDTGTYWVKRAPVATSRDAQNDGNANALWEASLKLSGLRTDTLATIQLTR